MNPPTALHGAMSRERKPFTYTPGGLNLSEIKSERMAKRLMRNAMNQGVPETPVHNIKSPPISSNMAIPNFNCLPVQVFPTFNLPSNPKSLLRTRSNPDQPKEPPTKKTTTAPHVSTSFKPTDSSTNEPLSFNNNINPYSSVNNNNYVNNTRPASMYEYNMVAPYTNVYDAKTSYGSDGYSVPLLPEKSYDEEYFQVTPQGSKALGKIEFGETNIEIPQSISEIKPEKKISFEVLEKPVTDDKCDHIEIPKPLEDTMATYDDQKEVKIQKEVNVTENQNGDANVEAAITVKLPVKKSAAKTETRVEIENQILPDGTVEETKTTTTKTTVDGKTDISTKVEKRTLSKEEADAVIVVEEEEEEEEEVEEIEPETKGRVVTETTVTSIRQEETRQVDNGETETIEKSGQKSTKENGHEDLLIKQEERQEVTTTKKVVIVQSEDEEEEIVEEEEETEDIEEVEIKKKSQIQEAIEKHEIENEYDLQQPDEIHTEEQEVDEENEEVEHEETKTEETHKEVDISEKDDAKDNKDVDEIEEKEEKSEVKKSVTQEEITEEKKEEEEEEVEEVEEEEEYEEAEESETKQDSEVPKQDEEKPVAEDKDEGEVPEQSQVTQEAENKPEEIPIKVIIETSTTDSEIPKEDNKKSEEEKPTVQSEQKQPLREPSIPLEKVIDVEIKPIGLGNNLFTKSHTEIITTSVDKPGALSTQTEYNRIENIVTVNRTTKTLDQAYEQMIQPSVPTVKTYFAPSRDKAPVSPQFNRPYQPVYPPEQTERRHSLLLERLSMERQLPPTDIYQNYQYNQTEENLLSQEPQSEVLTVSNVKPSTITKNQQWYQQTKKENVTYNNVAPTISTTPSQQWNQPQPQTQQQPQYQSQPQPQFQSQPQPQYQSQPQYHSPQPQYQLPQPQYQQQPSVQQSYTENTLKDTHKTTNNYTQNLYPNYSPSPSNWTSNVDNQNSYLKKDSTETYEKSTHQYSSSYVPPPWEQDSGYVADNTNQNFYQVPPPTSTFDNSSKSGWKPTPPAAKFTKPPPTSYIPPAPNQSFVKPVSNVEPPILPGRKTYYSEYERRYISVPEATYIPTESKYQAQPDPSPKCYYDNNEPVETIEPQWRKELREFTEKTSQTIIQTEQTSVRPPWEEDPKYVKTEYTPTPTWSQTLKPRSWRERSFETEYASKEWPKTNTLGRGRPQSSYVKSGVDSPIPERTRGVSVDRYNPNSYQSPIPSEHPPVQTYTLNPNMQQNYHNPNVPAYNARAAADNREQTAIYQQPRQWGESRATPIQSRSFKYLQWITGTED